MYASYIGHDTIVRILLEAGVNVNVPTPEGQTPLMLASSCGNESVAAFLLQVGVLGNSCERHQLCSLKISRMTKKWNQKCKQGCSGVVVSGSH